MASGLSPSKLTINTRLTFGVGVTVSVGRGISIRGDSNVLGMRVCVGGGAMVGVGEEATNPQLCRNRKVKIQILLNVFKTIHHVFYKVRFHEP